MGNILSAKDGQWSGWDNKCGTETRKCNNPEPGFWGGKDCVGDSTKPGVACPVPITTIQNVINSQGKLESQEITVLQKVERFSSSLNNPNIYDHNGVLLSPKLAIESGVCETNECYYDITLLNQVDSTNALFQDYLTSTDDFMNSIRDPNYVGANRVSDAQGNKMVVCNVSSDDGLGNICEHIIIKNMNDVNKVENYFKYWINKSHGNIHQSMIDDLKRDVSFNGNGVMLIDRNGTTYKAIGGMPQGGDKCSWLEKGDSIGMYDTLCMMPLQYMLFSLLTYRYKYNKELIPVALTPEEIETNKSISFGFNTTFFKNISKRTCELANDPTFVPYNPDFTTDRLNFSSQCYQFNPDWI